MNLLNMQKYFREGMLILDALNQLMVDDRADDMPADLMAELREAAPKAIKTRLQLPALLRAIVLPMPALGTVRLDYLTTRSIRVIGGCTGRTSHALRGVKSCSMQNTTHESSHW